VQDLGARFQVTGEAQKWRLRASETARQILAEVNGPLLEHMIAVTDYSDHRCADALIRGAPIAGRLPVTGNGTLKEFRCSHTLEELRANAPESNRQLIASLREDEHALSLYESCVKDAKLGRMTHPQPCGMDGPEGKILSPRHGVLLVAVVQSLLFVDRFAVVQGEKIRPIDDMSRSGINGACQPGEKLSYDGIDMLLGAAAKFIKETNVVPMIWKADIDAAFRRIPLAQEQLFASWVVFLLNGVPHVAGSFLKQWHHRTSSVCCAARASLRTFWGYRLSARMG